MKKEKINFDLTKVYVKEYCNIAMCYNCCYFGHVAKHCKLEVRCYKCGQKHESKNCKEETPLNCINCERLRLKERIHSARDPNCPAFLQKVTKYKQSTNYGGQKSTDEDFLGTKD